MACGNNHVSREHLSSQPVSIGKAIATPDRFKALKSMPGTRVNVYVDEHGRSGGSKSAQAEGPRHVHIVYNAEMSNKKGSAPTGLVMVQVTDRTQATAMDHLQSTPLDPKKGGHHEMTLFLRPQSPERIEAEGTRAVSILQSRARGDR